MHAASVVYWSIFWAFMIAGSPLAVLVLWRAIQESRQPEESPCLENFDEWGRPVHVCEPDYDYERGCYVTTCGN
jgi:hypothetical protein